MARRANGDEFPIEASISCLPAETGHTYTLIIRDVSDRVAYEKTLEEQTASLAATTDELKQLNEELHRRQLELERAMTARSRFYASEFSTTRPIPEPCRLPQCHPSFSLDGGLACRKLPVIKISVGNRECSHNLAG